MAGCRKFNPGVDNPPLQSKYIPLPCAGKRCYSPNLLDTFHRALKQLQRQFDAVLEFTGLSAKGEDSDRTLYSLRHSSIMFRLMFGSSIDTLTLARNARTSPEMIDRFYAAPLQGEMNVGELQSKRLPRLWD